MSRRTLDNERGFALVLALFVIVVLAAVGLFMVTIFGVENATPIQGLQGARAYQAARGGLEWGTSRALAGNCAAATNFNLGGFAVTVTCGSQNVTEGPMSYHVYQLHATAAAGTYGQPDYVQRRLEVRVTDVSLPGEGGG